jgi:hypothetical protein
MPNSTYVVTAGTASNFVYGTYNVGDDFWQKGTTNVVHCGIGAPDWKANNTYNDGDRVQPKTAVDAGDYIYQIILPGNAGTSGSSPPTWNQIAGSDTTENFGTTNVPVWRNTGIGTAREYACDGHTWKGFTGLGAGKNFTYHTYTDPTFLPSVSAGPRGILGRGSAPRKHELECY